jgi:regulator of RNase E activity RraA
MAAPVDEMIERYGILDSTCVSDAMDKLGINGGCPGILPMVSGARAVGTAFTVRYRPCGMVEKGSVGDFLDDVRQGQVVVLDNAGRGYGTVWGDIMTVYAHQKGISGTVIDGVCRDLPKILEMGYPLFARGRLMITGKGRVEVDGINVPVSISDVQVRPNDIVLCDDTGVVIIPAEKAEEILSIAEGIHEKEQAIIDLITAGMSLREAREKVGYHTLQSKDEEE